MEDRLPYGRLQVASRRARQGTRDYRGNRNYPTRAHIFALDARGEPPQGFGLLTPSTYADSVAGRPVTGEKIRNPADLKWSYERSPSRVTPDGNPFTTAWQRAPNGLANCRATYHWRDGAHVHIVFQSPPDEIELRGSIADEHLRKLLETLGRETPNDT